MSTAEEIAKLQRLHAEGALTDAEYEAAKRRALSGRSGGGWLWLAVFAAIAGAVAAAIWYLQPQDEPVAEAFAAGCALVAGAIAAVKSQLEDLPMVPAILVGLLLAAIGTVVLVGGAVLILPVLLPAGLVLLLYAWIAGWFGA